MATIETAKNLKFIVRISETCPSTGKYRTVKEAGFASLEEAINFADQNPPIDENLDYELVENPGTGKPGYLGREYIDHPYPGAEQ